jgi:hypothetical protein
MGRDNLYCLGVFGCSAHNSFYILSFQALYILFWTWLLDIICKNGGEPFSWLLVLLPFILFFILVALMLFI